MYSTTTTTFTFVYIALYIAQIKSLTLTPLLAKLCVTTFTAKFAGNFRLSSLRRRPGSNRIYSYPIKLSRACDKACCGVEITNRNSR